MTTYTESAKTSYFFGGEFRPYKQMFESHCPPAMKLIKGMRICRQSESKGWIYYLCSGFLKVYANNCEGNERIVAFLKSDTLFGIDCFSENGAYLMTIECMTDCWVMPFQGSMMETMIRENADFAVSLTHYYCKIMRQLCYDAENQSINNVLIRTINFLCANWDDQENNYVPFSQQDIAAAVNCSRSSISRICKIMKKEGAIISEGIGFRIIDQPKLISLCQKYDTFS